MIELELCKPFYYSELCPELGADLLVRKFNQWRDDGYDIRLRYVGWVGVWRQYVAYFESEADAAFFKLKYL